MVRDMNDVVASAVSAGWAKSPDELPVRKWSQDVDCWQQKSQPVRIQYDAFFSHPELHVIVLAGYIAAHLGINWSQASFVNMTADSSRFRSTDANPQIPGRLFSNVRTRA
jgi:hypothetical protein